MKSDLIHPRALSWLRATTSRAIPAIIVLLFVAGSAYGQSIPGFQAPDKPPVKDDTPAGIKAARGEVPFNRMYGHLKLDSTKTKRLGQLSRSEKQKKKGDKVLRTGVVRPLTMPLDPVSDSALYTVAEGYIRVAGVVSEGAVAVRVQFKDMSLPPGARVFVYSLTNPNEYYGPYEGRGESEDGTFWTPPIRGDTAVIEYFTPARSDSAKTPFNVFSIAHVYKDMTEEAVAGACNVEVTADWLNVAKSVGRIDFVTGGFVASCTGTLLNNLANDQKPYFLTANHCISNQTEAQSVTVYWNYNTGDTPPGGTPQTNGANLLVTGTSSDFSLLLLTGSVPGGLFFSGWDSASFNSTAAGTAIHHPQASHKRISFGTARQPNAGNCLPGQQCLRVDWSNGITEVGSSGSGIWIGNPSDPGGPRLIGNLIGGVSSCGGAPSEMWDVYGRFSVTYPSVSSFLEGTACVTSLGPTSQNFTNSGGSGSFNVTAPGGCNWTAVPSDSFITITSGSNGGGNGTVSFSVASNGGPQRTATIVVGGQVFSITQGGGGACAATPISIGQTVNGNLTTNDCPLGDGTFYDTYSFNGTAGQQVAVSMTSSQFDTYLFLNRPDGSVLAENDDGGGGTNSRIPPGSGFITLPVTGTYTIWANAFEASDTTGSYSVTLSGPVQRTLTVASSNPNSGITVQVIPNDNNGLSNGTTQFTRTYNQFATVTLIAPGTAGGDLIFLKWLKDGADWSSSSATSVTMDVDHTMTAVYAPPPTFTLTVGSTNPSSGVSINVSPNDNGGLGNGTTQFTRTYTQFTTVNLTAPINGGGNSFFQKWQRNGVDLTTTRTTSVNMNSNQTMTAVYITLPPPPPPDPTPTPSGPGQSVAYQINPAHTGSQFDTVSPPLVQRWSRDLGSPVSYPLIAGGKIFVVAGTTVYALDSESGATVWGPIEIGLSRGLAYDSGRVFAVNHDGLLRGLDAMTGTQVWSRQLSGQAFTSPPTAMAGTVYVSGLGTFYAVSAQDGTVIWSNPNAGGDQSSPAVTTTAVYVSYTCPAFSLSSSTGAIIWQLTSPCFGGGGRTPVFYNGRVYIRNNSLQNLALDSATGIPVAEFQTGPAPAFHGSTGFFLNTTSTLEARDISSGALKWSFTGDGNLRSAPIVVNGTVYIGSTGGKLYALDESTGTNVWTGTVGASVNPPDETNLLAPLTGLGAGEGLIVVPASNLVVAYQSAPAGPPVIYAEEGTNNAATIDSVTFVRGPFRLTNPNNLFTADKRTRIILITSNLGLTQFDLNDPAALVVEASGVNLPVENVGPLAITGLSSSYVIVRLPDNLPSGALQLTIKLRGVTSDARVLNISP
ncbi:MAG TPA: PQQ-binding-like beta-propeller repeat protein [Pyrinomonadaceae bacterium]|nr:PQQ-binding-like beta-propeller repeat protein [Pyrinomonadaceae bacterium]